MARRPPRIRRSPGGPARAAAALVAAALALAPGRAAAQPGEPRGHAGGDAGFPAATADDGPRLFPRVHYFPSPLADLREPRVAGALIGTDLFAAASTRERPPFQFPRHDDPSFDVQAAVALGFNVPIWRPLIGPDGGLLLGFQVGVHARFRIERPSRDNVGTDWVAAIPLEAAHGRWSGRLRLLHRSAHLGDELAAETGARRIEYSHEAVDAIVAYGPTPGTRVYAGGTFVFRSVTAAERWLAARGFRDRASIQAGLEAEWPGLSGGRAAPVAALDWQRAQRTEWDDELSLAAGVRMSVEGRQFRLLLRYFEGPSPLGEFFLTPESFWGLEFIGDL